MLLRDGFLISESSDILITDDDGEPTYCEEAMSDLSHGPWLKFEMGSTFDK